MNAAATGYFWLTKGESLVVRPDGSPFLVRTRTPTLYPIGAADPGYVDPFDVYGARLRNTVTLGPGVGPTRPATSDELLAAFHGIETT